MINKKIIVEGYDTSFRSFENGVGGAILYLCSLLVFSIVANLLK